MRAIPTSIPGVTILESDWQRDARGGFMRSFCERDMADAGLPFHSVQTNLSHNILRGTLRGLHYQDMRAPEPKIVRCLRGVIYDVALDMRVGSRTFGKWEAVELSAQSARALFIDGGIAHGFISLGDDTDLLYHMGAFYQPELARTVRWNDPMFNIHWPMQPAAISPGDASAPDYPG
ncbi:MAG: dTDP-4-dehydrorhamnose 3,5-epimerase [Alphaproteobacteria bacterium]|nr:dTDP-4-dehydrorhamnose 3,5-epimerase [Alphaproteobacteria bacterium]